MPERGSGKRYYSRGQSGRPRQGEASQRRIHARRESVLVYGHTLEETVSAFAERRVHFAPQVFFSLRGACRRWLGSLSRSGSVFLGLA